MNWWVPRRITGQGHEQGRRGLLGRMRMVVCDMIQRPRELARGRERGFSAGEGRVSRKVGRASRDRTDSVQMWV